MVKRRNRQQQSRVKRMHPGKSGKRITLAIRVPQNLARRIVGVRRIKRHLIEVPPRGTHQAQLVLRADVVDQRSKSTVTIRGVTQYRRSRRLQSQIRAASAGARVVRESVGVPAKINLVVALIEISK